jgi:hypothetical protein
LDWKKSYRHQHEVQIFPPLVPSLIPFRINAFCGHASVRFIS